jgi:hypothetical protein
LAGYRLFPTEPTFPQIHPACWFPHPPHPYRQSLRVSKSPRTRELRTTLRTTRNHTKPHCEPDRKLLLPRTYLGPWCVCSGHLHLIPFPPQNTNTRSNSQQKKSRHDTISFRLFQPPSRLPSSSDTRALSRVRRFLPTLASSPSVQAQEEGRFR